VGIKVLRTTSACASSSPAAKKSRCKRHHGPSRLQQFYRESRPDLTEKFGYKSPMQVPRLTKITLNMGVSEAVADKKVMEHAVAT
jgi:hypothetical protein